MHALPDWSYLRSSKYIFSMMQLHALTQEKGSSTCHEHCPAGQFIDSDQCSPCAAGTFSSADAISCSQCTANTFSGSGASSCTNCANGATSDPVSWWYYCDHLDYWPLYVQGSSTCTQHCSAGQFKDGDHCSPCVAGTYSSADTLSCIQCPANTFSPAGVGSCTPCEAGKTSSPVRNRCFYGVAIHLNCIFEGLGPWPVQAQTTRMSSWEIPIG